jgi:hypothetical protein
MHTLRDSFNTAVSRSYSRSSNLIYICDSLDDAFTSLGKPSKIYLAITSEDASIVYYKISAGIVKPSM